jgi:hypothetical protein
MSGKAVRETLAALGVIAWMVFVGLELRQSNVQARAASYQAIGIATAELHRRFACSHTDLEAVMRGRKTPVEER